jgi:hypothetical protein
VTKGRSVAVCAHGPPSVGASVMVVHESAEAHVLLPPSQVQKIWPSFVQVTMTQRIQYTMCHGKVVMSFKARPPEFTALWLDPTMPPPIRLPV